MGVSSQKVTVVVMSKYNYRNICRALFVLYVAVLAFLCFGNFKSMPDVPRCLFGIPMDKVVHFAMYLPFVPLGYLSFGPGRNRNAGVRIAAVALALIAGIALGAGVELLQGLTEYRSCDVADWYADALGACVGALAIPFVSVLIARKNG